jgi:hypothetical protein
MGYAALRLAFRKNAKSSLFQRALLILESFTIGGSDRHRSRDLGELVFSVKLSGLIDSLSVRTTVWPYAYK